MSDPVLESRLSDEADETVQTAEPSEVNKQRKKYARTRADRLKFIQAAMQHEEGRAWFFDILTHTEVLTNYFDESAHKTYFMLGKRNVGFSILSDIQEAAPNEYLQMIKENKRNK